MTTAVVISLIGFLAALAHLSVTLGLEVWDRLRARRARAALRDLSAQLRDADDTETP